jgi:hypothetical protein
MWQLREKIRGLITAWSTRRPEEHLTVADGRALLELLGELAGETASATDPRNYDPHWVPGH